MSTLQEKVLNVQTSFGRCSINPSFLEDFYSVFIKSHPSLKEIFKNTDMAAQRSLLKNGLTYMIMYAGGSGIAKNKIEKLGESHSRAGMNIPPDLYIYWINSLLKVIKIHDKNMTKELFEDWKIVIVHGVDKMKSMY